MTSIECEDDVWDEIRVRYISLTKNFMKCLTRMFAEQNKGVIFFEQAEKFKKKRHCVIECIPIPADEFNLVPAYFKVSSIL
jgi:hypothetical protein